MPPEPRPFALEAVRDLLGLCRAMWACEQDVTRKAELAEIGKQLRDAVDLARKAPTGSLGWKAATKRAEEATDRLCAIVAGDVLGSCTRRRKGFGGDVSTPVTPSDPPAKTLTQIYFDVTGLTMTTRRLRDDTPWGDRFREFATASLANLDARPIGSRYSNR